MQRDIDGLIAALLDDAGVVDHKDLVTSLVHTALDLGTQSPARLDLKIANTSLQEMAEAFRTFQPYRAIRKVTIFGSARTAPADPLYSQARDLARAMADRGWMVVTGAGEGIMAAGSEGAGREMSLGVNIRLPHEQEVNAFIATDPKLVQMRYFFTRKLMLIKESSAYVALPGGFGTLDEMFELLTLVQTGKAEPAPIVLLDVPGGQYWSGWDRFLRERVVSSGMVSADDLDLYRITDDVSVARDELLGFYANYHSCRWVGDLLVLRLKNAPDNTALQELNVRFADIASRGRIRTSSPLPPERSDRDNVDLPRIALRFDRRHYGRLRTLIDALNAGWPATPGTGAGGASPPAQPAPPVP